MKDISRRQFLKGTAAVAATGVLGMAGLGAYLCGADNKMATLKRLINRIIPGRK